MEKVVVEENTQKKRIDSYIVDKNINLSRTAIKRLLDECDSADFYIRKSYLEKQELIDYLKEQIKLCKEAQQLALNNKMIEQVGNFNLRIATYSEILSKIEKE